MSRYDLYRRPHKALRALMADTLVALGRADPQDECEMREAASRLEEMLAICEKHAALEDEFVHPAMEERRAQASCALALAHHEHAIAIDDLRECARRGDPTLYRRAAVFVAGNFRHMEDEESAGNALLWELFTDAELLAIEARLIAAVPPGAAMQTMRWMLGAMSHGERVTMLEALRERPGVFDGAMGIAQAHLRAADFQRLEAALAQREPATLES